MSAPLYTFEYYRDRKREHRWRVVHRNGKILATSSEGYKRKRDAIKSAEGAMQALVLALTEQD